MSNKIRIDFSQISPQLSDPDLKKILSPALRYHIEMGIPIKDCVFDENSSSYRELMIEVKKLVDENIVILSHIDRIIVEDYIYSTFL